MAWLMLNICLVLRDVGTFPSGERLASVGHSATRAHIAVTQDWHAHAECHACPRQLYRDPRQVCRKPHGPHRALKHPGSQETNESSRRFDRHVGSFELTFSALLGDSIFRRIASRSAGAIQHREWPEQEVEGKCLGHGLYGSD